MFFRVLSKIFFSTYSDWERPFQQVFSKKFCSPKEQPARKFEMCGFQGIIFSSLIPTERGRLGSYSQKKFLPSRGRSRERLKIKPFEKIYFSSLNRQATRMIKNRAFAVNIFLPQVVEHENADFMNGFRNFRKIPSRGGAREREKYKVFSKIIFSSQGIEHENSIFMNDFENFSPIWQASGKAKTKLL